MSITDLPALNAFLNTTAAVFLSLGYFFMKKKNIPAHRNCMITAFAASCVFLTSYLIYHYHAGSVKFQGQGAVRYVYFTILLTHTILAVVIVPMIFMTFSRALKQKYELHRKIARWTWPLWMYVSVTGVIVYLMLYQLFPGAPKG